MKKKVRRSASAGARRGDSPPNLLLARLQKLSTSQSVLAKAFNQNTEAFSQSLTFVDAMLWLLRAAMNDMINDRLLTTTEDGVKQVDLAAYLQRYEQHLKAEEREKPRPRINGSTDPLDPIIFGGDS